MEKKVIDWVDHEHPLILTENVSRDATPNCYGCGIPVIDLEVAYVCTVQNCSNRIILHKKCGELPGQILHPKHPRHPLHLFDYHRLPYYFCTICMCYIDKGYGYRCSTCDFDVDLRCERIRVDDRLEGKIQVEHPSHPDHPLTLMRKYSFSFYCNGCGVKDVDMAFICSTCEFMVHKTCASLPLIVPINLRYHHHHLSLAFSFPMDHHRYIRDCDVCYKLLDKTCWVYFCGYCRFFAHIRCVAPTNAETAQDSNSDGDDKDGLNVILFPLHAHDISEKLITPFVMREKGLNDIPDVADMPAQVHMPQTTASFSFLFNYHSHPLSLVSELSNKDDEVDPNYTMDESDEDDELKICDVCVTPIFSPPYYECAPCKYFVHSICSFLPKTLSSSSSSAPVLYGDCPKTHDKNHKLTLYTSSRFMDMDPNLCRCEACGIITNGMVYECEVCEMKIDVKCASLPTTIRHASHQHRTPLVLTRIPPAREEAGKRKYCHGCKYLLGNCIAYCCSSDDCDFALDLRCAMRPASITVREWDKYHSLMLSFDASLDHPSDFFCDYCEREMHPKWWMYHCRQCDLSFHFFCLRAASGWYRNIKFGRRFVLDGVHPNQPLTFNHITIKRRCDLYHVYVYNYCGFECASCYYVVCMDCARRELAKMMY